MSGPEGPTVEQPAGHEPGRSGGPLLRLRRMSRRTPLRIKLVVAVLVLVTVGLAGSAAASITAMRHYLLSKTESELSQALRPFIGPRDFARAFPGDAGSRVRLPSQFFVQVSTADGTPVGTASQPLDSTAGVPDLPRLTLAQVTARAGKFFTVGSVGSGSEWVVVAAPLSGGDGSVMVARSLADLEGTMTRLTWLETVIGLTVLLLLAGAAYLTVRSSLRALEEVEHTAAAIAAGDLSQRMPDAPERTEVGQLSVALNSMLHQIEAAFREREASEAAARTSEERMRRFIADASHELRTPLTTIRGFAELYRQAGAAQDTATQARLIGRIEDEAKRMGLLVEDLLLLARMDQQRPLERTSVDLLGLASDAVHDARAVDPDRTISLEVLSGSQAPLVTGDDSRLRQVLGNLMANALGHTPAGTAVTVRVGTRPTGPTGGPWAVIEVADRGPGLSEPDRQRVFERFYRADTARSRAGEGGTGLGLAIVAALAAAHGGHVEVDSVPGQGSTFRVVLPLLVEEAEAEADAEAEPDVHAGADTLDSEASTADSGTSTPAESPH